MGNIISKNLLAVIVLAILVVAVPVSFYLAQQTQIFAPRAEEGDQDICDTNPNLPQCFASGVVPSPSPSPAANQGGNTANPPACKTTTICNQSAAGNTPADCTPGCQGTKAIYTCIQSDNSQCRGVIECAPESSRCAGGGTPPACKTTTICNQSAAGNTPADCTPGCQGTKAIYTCIQSDNSQCRGVIECAPESSRCAGGGTPSPSPSPGAGGPEGSECKYSFINTKGEAMTTRGLFERDTYQLRIEMINKGDTNWNENYKLKMESTPAGLFSSQFLPLTRLTSKGESALFSSVVVAPALVESAFEFNNYALKITMVNAQGAEFGAACSPQEVRVIKKPAGSQTTRCFVISENKAERDNVVSCSDSRAKPFTQQGMSTTIRLSGTNAGDRTIFVRFFGNTDADRRDFEKTINYSPAPKITNTVCTQSATGSGVAISINGTAFGASQGTGSLKTRDGKNLRITSWTDTAILATLEDARLEGDISVEVKTNEGKTDISTCSVGVTTIKTAVKLQCRTGDYALDNVDVKLYLRVAEADPRQPLLSQKVKVDKDGNILNFTPKVERDKNYTLVIKGPSTLAKKIEFTAKGGTTELDPVILPVGNIAPAALPDSKINPLDRSEMIKQWSLIKDVVKTADLDGNGRVNSLDWSCLRENNGKEDEVFTLPVVPSPSVIPSPVPSPNPSPSPSASPVPSPSASPVVSPSPRPSTSPSTSPSTGGDE